jgi:pyrroline-5-carboxylate reductase
VDPWFVYIAECGDKSLYVGIALVVKDRIAAHNAGSGARYTRGRGPVRALVTRRCASKGEALRLEARLKRLRREEKLAMASSRGKLARFARAVRASA